jgi:hypothetical protein
MSSDISARLCSMNSKGHPETLVAAQPGNTNALRSGVHSPRLIEARAAEIVAELGSAMELDEMGKIALWALGRLMAAIEAIDRDLGDRGLTDSRGKERYLLKLRERSLRQLDEATERVLQAQARVRKNRMLDPASEVEGETVDYVRALQRLALGYDPDARASDQFAALKFLIGLDRKGTTSNFRPKVDPYLDDPEIGEEVVMLRDELEQAEKQAHLEWLHQSLSETRSRHS